MMSRESYLETPPKAERDGCDCPPWVIRCIHFEGRVVALGYKRAWMAAHKADCSIRNSITANIRLEEWAFYWPTDWWVCRECGAPRLTAIEPFNPPRYFTDADAALAAFHEAEEALLRGAS